MKVTADNVVMFAGELKVGAAASYDTAAADAARASRPAAAEVGLEPRFSWLCGGSPDPDVALVAS